MKTTNFLEYMNSKGKLVEPVTTNNGDNVDPKTAPTTPPQGGKPYMVKGGKEDKIAKIQKGLGDEGEDIAKCDYKSDAKLTKVGSVKEMSLIHQTIQSVRENPSLIETIVRQLKANGLLGAFVAESLNHKETYSHISEVMSHNTYGPEFCSKLVRAMNEEVAAPFSAQLNHEDDEDDEDSFDNDLDASNPFSQDDEFDSDLELEDDDFDPNAPPSLDADPNEDPSLDANMDPNGDQSLDLEPAFNAHPALKNFKRAMMKAFMRAYMSK